MGEARCGRAIDSVLQGSRQGAWVGQVVLILGTVSAWLGLGAELGGCVALGRRMAAVRPRAQQEWGELAAPTPGDGGGCCCGVVLPCLRCGT